MEDVRARARRRKMAQSAAETRAWVTRITDTIDRASPADTAAGIAWYDRASDAATALAAQHGTTRDRAAYVIAALSPRVQWSVNLRWADAVMAAWARGDATPPGGGLGRNLRAAWAILAAATDADALETLRGPKVSAFARNITGDPYAVTVDVWAARVATGGDRYASNIKTGLYGRLADAYRRAAAARGMTPRDAQATAWIVARGRVA